jgi:DNA-binding transcriptional ArsR family regulator
MKASDTLVHAHICINRIRAAVTEPLPVDEAQRVYQAAADLFAVMATPQRLRIIAALCDGEKNVGSLVAAVGGSQPNLSQHLATLYRAGILAKRREGQQIWYSVCNPKAVSLCRAVCTQIAIEFDHPASVPLAERLAPAHASRSVRA